MRTSGKYQLLMIGMLLLAYLTAAFQKPVFEMLHVLSHYQELVHKDYIPHHYLSHTGDHQHSKLAHLHTAMSIQDGADTSDKQHFTSLEQIKIPELANTHSFPAFSFLKPLISPFYFSFISKPAFISVNLPPPKAGLV